MKNVVLFLPILTNNTLSKRQNISKDKPEVKQLAAEGKIEAKPARSCSSLNCPGIAYCFSRNEQNSKGLSLSEEIGGLVRVNYYML